MRYAYSRWDGLQERGTIDPYDLIAAIADDLFAGGDIEAALQQAVRDGVWSGDDQLLPGIAELLEDLRRKRQEELERYDLDSALDDIAERVREVMRAEREGIERRRRELAGDDTLTDIFERIVERKLRSLDELETAPASAVGALADYEFMDDAARRQFRDLEERLERHVLESHLRTMERSLRELSGEALEDFKSMLGDLNAMLRDQIDGASPDFERFRALHGRHFPGAPSLDALLDGLEEQSLHSEALMVSMSPEMRRPLEELMKNALGDVMLREELANLAEALQALRPQRGPIRGYPFSGSERVTLDEALQLMRRMHEVDRLERGLTRAIETGDGSEVDLDAVRRLLGPRAHHSLSQLVRLTETLAAAGYLSPTDSGLQLTARGIRKIGQKALYDIFADLKGDRYGGHSTGEPGAGGDSTQESKPFEFGDQFLLDLHGTMMNAVQRDGASIPLALDVHDLRVFSTERPMQASTVLMLDMSRSMPLRGCFVAARKVVLALNSLIRLQYPRDNLYIVGFSDYARPLRPEALAAVNLGDYVYGTNMQHGFMVARRLLRGHPAGSRQIILITDGEPTAHFEGGRVQFAYPPTFRTFQETLREVKRCTRDGIVINTFMLDRSHYLTDFVTQMTRINRGRALFTTPERLGDYILVDYVTNRRRSA